MQPKFSKKLHIQCLSHFEKICHPSSFFSNGIDSTAKNFNLVGTESMSIFGADFNRQLQSKFCHAEQNWMFQ